MRIYRFLRIKKIPINELEIRINVHKLAYFWDILNSERFNSIK